MMLGTSCLCTVGHGLMLEIQDSGDIPQVNTKADAKSIQDSRLSQDCQVRTAGQRNLRGDVWHKSMDARPCCRNWPSLCRKPLGTPDSPTDKIRKRQSTWKVGHSFEQALVGMKTTSQSGPRVGRATDILNPKP